MSQPFEETNKHCAYELFKAYHRDVDRYELHHAFPTRKKKKATCSYGFGEIKKSIAKGDKI